MYQIPSLMLSEVLEDAGVSEDIITKRRQSSTIDETMTNIKFKMKGGLVTQYNFGSLSEGTTTLGLNSDRDVLGSVNDISVITDLADWKFGALNLLILHDEDTTPGHCMLQSLRSYAPLPESKVRNEHEVRNRHGRILLKKSLILSGLPEGREQHGPAFAREGSSSYKSQDMVMAFHCKTLPREVLDWLDRPTRGSWPTQEMKRWIRTKGCFVVPVSCRDSVNAEFEWRISTSCAEKCLMFSLNITQLRVYVLMKMLLKEKLNVDVHRDHHISSYMCKTVLLHCIEKSDFMAWQSHNLLPCLLYCLYALRNSIMHKSCPHFIIHENNIMSGKFTEIVKNTLHRNITAVLRDIMEFGILDIKIDDIGKRMLIKIHGQLFAESNLNIHTVVLILAKNIAESRQELNMWVLKDLGHVSFEVQVETLYTYLCFLEQIYKEGGTAERKGSRLLVPLFCTTLGSLLASDSIRRYGGISPEALEFLRLGSDSDVASSRLKLATAFYSAGDMHRTEHILIDVENRFTFQECCCKCYEYQKTNDLWFLCHALGRDDIDETHIPELFASCVIFTRNEIQCIPIELQYEMFRSTQDDLQHRSKESVWMDFAVIDSLPYMQFLQYKTYGRLQRPDAQQRALSNLIQTIESKPNLGHRETALNLLGQCMEQENKPVNALKCYSLSLNIRPRNNVAKIHICILLNKLFTRPAKTSSLEIRRFRLNLSMMRTMMIMILLFVVVVVVVWQVWFTQH